MKKSMLRARAAQIGAILCLLALGPAAVWAAAPSITILYPETNSIVTTRTPLVRARIQDMGTGVDISSIKVRIDGVLHTGFTFNATTGLLNYLVSPALTLTSHTLTVDASDDLAQPGATATVYFRVVLPTLDPGLHLFSLPFVYESSSVPTPTDIFGLAGGVQVARWWTGDSSYHIYPDAFASFYPPDATPPTGVVPSPAAGLAYFVNLPTEVTLNVTGTPVTSPNAYRIRLYRGTQLPRGWNMIGDPFTSTVGWSSVQFETNGVVQGLSAAVASGVTDGVLFSFVNTATGGYYTFPSDPFAATMEPFQGYWVHVNKDTTLLITPPSVGASQVRPAAMPVASPKDGWRLQLAVAAAGLEDPCNYVGVSAAATGSYSTSTAVPEPPAVDSRLTACLVERQWGDQSGAYAMVLKPSSGKQTWDLEVTCRLAQTEVRLRWPELNAVVPAGTALVLQDLDSGQEVYMRTSAGYTYNSGEGGVRHLRITAAPAGSLSSLGITGLSVQAAPGGGMAFTYALSQPAGVTAEIRNISGKLIRRLTAGQSTGGQVELLVWNGRNEYGSKVPGGRYLLSIVARAESGQTVQALRPFEVNP